MKIRAAAAISALSFLAVCLFGCEDTAQSVTPDQWVGSYAFFESVTPFENMRYDFTITEEAGVYTAHCYIFGFKTLNEFEAAVSFGKNSVDFVFEKYADVNLSEPFNKGDKLLTLKMDRDKLLTYWGVMRPKLKENESQKDCFYTTEDQYGAGVDIWNKESPLLRDTVLVNELAKGDQGFFYLGMTLDELVSALDEKGICYSLTDIEAESITNFELIFYLFDNYVRIHLSEKRLDSIDIIGSIPLESAISQAGLKLGDTFDRMVALYGDDYTVTDLSEAASIVTGHHYKYDLGGHYLEIWIETDTVSAWGISA